jgi:hypothetical protein
LTAYYSGKLANSLKTATDYNKLKQTAKDTATKLQNLPKTINSLKCSIAT